MDARRVVFLIVVLLALVVPMSAVAGAHPGDRGLERAIAAQEAHTDRLLELPGVIGTAVGASSNGTAVVQVLLLRPGVQGVPSRLDGTPVQSVVTGMITAREDPTARYRPAPIGVSTGHPEITAGTIGARVKDGNGNVFALSNNHVLANSNDAAVGDSALQPGPYDGGSDPGDKIGELHAFAPIDFSGGDNLMDAAIAISSTSDLGNATLSDGYGTPGTDPLDAYVGLNVQKSGRTTDHTRGEVAAINATVSVCYEARGPFGCAKAATFIDQIIVTPGDFSAGGDSGSLIVTDDADKRPVGLLFAGSSSYTIANPIEPVLSYFGVSIDGSAADASPSVEITSPADGDTVSGSISVTADASDDDGVTQVEFFVDGGSIGVDDDESDGWSASWDTTAAGDGSHAVSATATDTAGQSTDSDSVSVNVDNVDDPPSVGITNPADGSTVSGMVSVTADASDDNEVTQIEFFVDGSSIGVDSDGLDGWSASWDTSTVGDGSHTVSATATDTAGQTASDSVTVSVDNSVPETMHVGDLSGSSINNGSAWTAVVEISIVDGAGNGVEGATVEGSWSGGASGGDSCVTGVDGTCTVSIGGVHKRVSSVTWTVDNVADTLTYDPQANVETTITVSKP